jgi:hypothetical protein
MQKHHSQMGIIINFLYFYTYTFEIRLWNLVSQGLAIFLFSANLIFARPRVEVCTVELQLSFSPWCLAVSVPTTPEIVSGSFSCSHLIHFYFFCFFRPGSPCALARDKLARSHGVRNTDIRSSEQQKKICQKIIIWNIPKKIGSSVSFFSVSCMR